MLLWIFLGATLVLALTIGTLYAKYGYYAHRFSWSNFAFGAGTTTALGLVVSFMILPMVISVTSDSNKWNTEKFGLKAIVTDTEQNSRWSYFLVAGSGSSGETEEYKFIRQYEDGGYHMDEVAIWRATIYEEPGKPYVVEKEGYYWDPAIWPWGLDPGDSTLEYEFHVPEATVVESYNIDIND